MAARFAVFGTRVRTQDPNAPTATALAWSDGRILAVGDEHDVRAVCAGTTQVIDGSGLTVTPGLVDGHQHLFHGAETGQGVNFDRVSSLEGLRQLIRAERERLGPGAWVQGYALEYAAFEGARYHHTLLDEAAGDGPML